MSKNSLLPEQMLQPASNLPAIIWSKKDTSFMCCLIVSPATTKRSCLKCLNTTKVKDAASVNSAKLCKDFRPLTAVHTIVFFGQLRIDAYIIVVILVYYLFVKRIKR